MVRHEQGAAFMVDAYDRLTQKVGICLSTLGSGATNLITDIANAIWIDFLYWLLPAKPILVYVIKSLIKIWILYLPVTKWRWAIHIADVIPELVRRSFKISIEYTLKKLIIKLPENDSYFCRVITFILWIDDLTYDR